MTIRNLDKLLAPKSVALIGASPEPGSVGRIVAGNLARGGFKGPISLVNPHHTDIDGHRVVPTVAAMDHVPDLAVIVTPPAVVPQLIHELGDKGTRAAVVITAGLRGDLGQAMLAAARPYCLRIQGPNCLGLMVPGLGLDASFSHRAPRAGDLAFLSQSGALITGIVDWASERGIGFSHVVSLGDMADADLGDFLDYFAVDLANRAILVYMESVTHAPKFMSAARRAARVKPVIVIKAGRHAAAAKAAMSHTGALAGSDAAYDAAFRRAGLLRVRELDDLFDAAEMLSRVPRLKGERLMIVTNGGGAGVLGTDRLADWRGTLAALSPATRTALESVLPPTWSKANPVDIIGDAPPQRYEKALDIVLSDPEADAVLVINCPTALADSTLAARSAIAAFDRGKGAGGGPKPLLAAWLGDTIAEPGRAAFRAVGVPAFETPDDAVDGFMQLVRFRRAQEALLRAPPARHADVVADKEKAREIIDGARKSDRTVLSEVESKSLLAAYGIPVVPTLVAATPADVESLSRQLLAGSEAVAIKIQSEDISHKSDVGGVRLDLATPGEARDAARAMLARIGERLPAARIDGFTVQPMIKRPRAHELIAGMSVDATFGPMILFGAGGTAVEVVRDTAQALPPLDPKLAHDLIHHTRMSHLLAGYRDRPAADMDAIARVLVQLGTLVAEHAEIRELDINPLLADEAGVIALDARVRIQGKGEEPRTPMAIRPYPSEWERSLDLESGVHVLIRPIRPDDEGLYADFSQGLKPNDIRLRFFTPMKTFSREIVARLTQIDYAREMAFVAIERETGKLLGVSRFAADPDYRKGEFAVLVGSAMKGHGLGWALMQHLIKYATAEGLQELYGDVLAENSTMLRMCAELGFTIEEDREDPALRQVVLRLGTVKA